MDIIFKGRRTDVQERFRRHASAKLGKIERLDSRANRIDVEVSTERNPRQSDRRERVELTIRSRGPVIRAEAAADDRYAALDRALAKLEARLRRLGDRRKGRHSASPAERGAAPRPVSAADGQPVSAGPGSGPGAEGNRRTGRASGSGPAMNGPPAPQPPAAAGADDVIPIQMEGDGPLVVREKVHAATPAAPRASSTAATGISTGLSASSRRPAPTRHGSTARGRETGSPAPNRTGLAGGHAAMGGTRPQPGFAWRGPVGQSLIQGRRSGAVPGSSRPDALGAGPAAG